MPPQRAGLAQLVLQVLLANVRVDYFLPPQRHEFERQHSYVRRFLMFVRG